MRRAGNPRAGFINAQGDKMKITRKLAAVAAAVALASCGGGNDGIQYDSLVSFGDSLSDVGSYKTPAVANAGGGKYTVNGPDGKVWIERVAAALNVSAPCAAQTGLNATGQLAAFAAPVVDHPGCTAYGQGGSRVTNPVGPWNAALLASPNPATAFQGQLGQLTVPLVTQVARYLASKGGSFTGKEAVLVLAGGNDLFMNLGAVGSTMTPEQAVAAMGVAGAELAALIKNQIVGKGARYVAVVNLPNVALTPSSLAAEVATPGSKALTENAVKAFNAQLASGLNGVGNSVTFIDAYAQSVEQAANPGLYGLSNITTPACSGTSPLNPLPGYSLTCTTASTIAGDVSRYQYADSVHPTPYGHQLIADRVLAEMRKVGWY
jgi:outer membrane lipase/esterase